MRKIILLFVSMAFIGCSHEHTNGGKVEINHDFLLGLKPKSLDLKNASRLAVISETSTMTKSGGEISVVSSLYSVDENGDITMTLPIYEPVSPPVDSVGMEETFEIVQKAFKLVPSLMADLDKYILFSACRLEIDESKIALDPEILAILMRERKDYLVRKSDGYVFDNISGCFRYGTSELLRFQSESALSGFDAELYKWRYSYEEGRFVDLSYHILENGDMYTLGDCLYRLVDKGNSLDISAVQTSVDRFTIDVHANILYIAKRFSIENGNDEAVVEAILSNGSIVRYEHGGWEEEEMYKCLLLGSQYYMTFEKDGSLYVFPARNVSGACYGGEVDHHDPEGWLSSACVDRFYVSEGRIVREHLGRNANLDLVGRMWWFCGEYEGWVSFFDSELGKISMYNIERDEAISYVLSEDVRFNEKFGVGPDGLWYCFDSYSDNILIYSVIDVFKQSVEQKSRVINLPGKLALDYTKGNPWMEGSLFYASCITEDKNTIKFMVDLSCDIEGINTEDSQTVLSTVDVEK